VKPAPIIVAALIGVGALAATASAHPASVVCNEQGTGYLVTANPYQGATVADIAEGSESFKVTWTDGYTRTVAKPADCPKPPAPVVELPPVTVPPVLVTPTTPATTKPKPPRRRAQPITCLTLKRIGAGRGWYTRLGIPYYRCHMPPPRVFTPEHPFAGVAG
jgi:hypothetical protein